jgi:hypothetical protein
MTLEKHFVKITNSVKMVEDRAQRCSFLDDIDRY